MRRCIAVLPALFFLMAGLLGAGCNLDATRADRYLVSNLAEKYAVQGDKLVSENRPAEALLAYRQAALADPTYGAGLQRLAGSYAAQGQRRLAALLYEKLLAGRPAPSAEMTHLARRELAVIYAALGDQAAAAGHLRALVAAGDSAAQGALNELAAGAEAKTGLPEAWRKRLDSPLETLPGENVPAGMAVAGGVLYVTAQEGMLYALDAATGNERWRFDTGSSGSKRRVTSAPVLTGDLVLFGADDNILRALSPADGKLRWQFETKAQVFGPPAVDAEAAYIASADGTLYAVNLSDGKLRWNYALGEAAHTSPAVSEGVVYAGAQDMRLHAVSARDGTELWSFLTAGKAEAVAVASAGQVFFGSGDSRLYALNQADGAMNWYYSTGDAVYTQPVADGSVVYVASMGEALSALRTDTGKLLWEYNTDTPLRYAPILIGARLYLAPANDPVLVVLDAANGAVVARQDAGEWPACQPVAAGGLLYVAQRDSTVMALRLGGN
jgi:outer membrane protein assembly factor BamB